MNRISAGNYNNGNNNIIILRRIIYENKNIRGSRIEQKFHYNRDRISKRIVFFNWDKQRMNFFFS